MSQQDQHIKDIFSEKLGGFEAPVDPSLFAGVQAGISSSAGSAASGGSWIAGLSSGTKIVAAALITGAIGVGAWLATSNNNASSEDVVVEQSVQSEIESPSEENLDITLSGEEFSAEENTTLNQDAADAIDAAQATTAEVKVETPIEKTYRSEAIEPYELVRGAEEMTHTPDAPSPEPVQQNTASTSQDDQQTTPEVVVPVKADFTAVRSEGNPMMFEFKSVDAGEHATLWTLGDGHVSSAPVFTYKFEQEGEFEVELTVGEGENEQTHTTTVVAYVQPEVVIPNVFTPNGDAFNPYFDVESKSTNVTVMNVQVFDMNGNMVFESSDNEIKWDGNDRFGQPCAVGNYICLVQAIGVDQEPINQREIVSLKR